MHGVGWVNDSVTQIKYHHTNIIPPYSDDGRHIQRITKIAIKLPFATVALSSSNILFGTFSFFLFT